MTQAQTVGHTASCVSPNTLKFPVVSPNTGINPQPTEIPHMAEYLKVSEAAKIIRLSEETVRKMCVAAHASPTPDSIPCERFGKLWRIPTQEFNAWRKRKANSNQAA